MLDQLAPYSRPPGDAEQSAWDYAYHFDTHVVGAFLRARSQGVTHVEGTVNAVNLEPGNGRVRSVTLEDGREIAGDLFIDCSGFRKLIIGGAYDEEWISYAEHLPVNRALPFSVPHSEGASIPSYTHAWALSAGWLWQIPTQERMGSGYAYCDAFLSGDEAQAEVEAALGHPIEPVGEIAIASGRFRRLWIKNCIAIGLSGAFSEPLESTSIHGTLVQLLTLVQEVPQRRVRLRRHANPRSLQPAHGPHVRRLPRLPRHALPGRPRRLRVLALDLDQRHRPRAPRPLAGSRRR